MTVLYAFIGLLLIAILIHMDEDDDPPSGKLVPVRIPTKEPWSDHENFNPKEYEKDKTEAIKPDERIGYYKNGTMEEAEILPIIPDTFKR